MPAAADYTEQDRSRVETLLSSPLDLPDEFKKWILEYGAQHLPPVPINQLQGYVDTRIVGDEVATSEGTASTTYVALSTAGPSVSHLADGRYLVAHGCWITSDYGRMSLSYNSSTPTDADSVYVETGGSVTYSGVRLREVSLANKDNNDIVAYYRVDSSGLGGTAFFKNRWLAVIRIG